MFPAGLLSPFRVFYVLYLFYLGKLLIFHSVVFREAWKAAIPTKMIFVGQSPNPLVWDETRCNPLPFQDTAMSSPCHPIFAPSSLEPDETPSPFKTQLCTPIFAPSSLEPSETLNSLLETHLRLRGHAGGIPPSVPSRSQAIASLGPLRRGTSQRERERQCPYRRLSSFEFLEGVTCDRVTRRW